MGGGNLQDPIGCLVRGVTRKSLDRTKRACTHHGRKVSELLRALAKKVCQSESHMGGGHPSPNKIGFQLEFYNLLRIRSVPAPPLSKPYTCLRPNRLGFLHKVSRFSGSDFAHPEIVTISKNKAVLILCCSMNGRTSTVLPRVLPMSLCYHPARYAHRGQNPQFYHVGVAIAFLHCW